MVKSYHGTLFHPDLTTAVFELYLTEETKYEVDNFHENAKKVEYHNVVAWDLIEGGEEAELIEKDTDASGMDENHEYLVLHFANGETATFRNSHVIMFVW